MNGALFVSKVLDLMKLLWPVISWDMKHINVMGILLILGESKHYNKHYHTKAIAIVTEVGGGGGREGEGVFGIWE